MDTLTWDIGVKGTLYSIIYSDGCYYCTTNNTYTECINLVLSNSSITHIDQATSIIKNVVCKNDAPIVVEINDKYNIFKNDIISKYKLNNAELLTNFDKNYVKNTTHRNIPKELLLSGTQLFTMLMDEITKINTDMSYGHYIVCNNNNILDLSIRFVYNTGELGDKMKKIFDTFGYNYFELKFTLTTLYPFMPPRISYVRPRIDTALLNSILNMDIWTSITWNYTIPLEWIVINLASALEAHFNTYVDIHTQSNALDATPFNYIETKMLELFSSTKITLPTTIQIDLKTLKYDNRSTSITSPWKGGTGYGTSALQKWDIAKYIDSSTTIERHIESILNEIVSYIKQESIYDIDSMCAKYIIKQFSESSLLDFNNNLAIYKSIIEILDITNAFDIAQEIVEASNHIYDDIYTIITNDILSQSVNHDYMAPYLYLIDTINKYRNVCSDMNTLTVDNKVDISDSYCDMVKTNQYGTMTLTPAHRYYTSKNNPVSPATLLRIITEFTSLKHDLPLNWDSSVVMRTIPTNINLCSFIISGPKDTPYHNGLFEFHACFPDGYPNVVPQVLIHTTDNGKVRFNPNLYNNGKVCLSLLGTWSAEKGESWIPTLSTLFQVIISIQSLILVDEPYFNEPGYEITMSTPRGQSDSRAYNDKCRLDTIRVAMCGMLRNKSPTYEKFIEMHFKLKKDEILTTVMKWYNESHIKNEYNPVIEDLKNLLEL